MSGGARIKSGTFSERVQRHLRTSGYSQKELADVLSLHPKVLSRKLNGSGNAHLTRLEVQRIITTLAQWHVITTQGEVYQLLKLAQIEPSVFSSEEWQSPPLSTLAKDAPSATSNVSGPPPLETALHNLPGQTTRLIGREWAVERLKHLFGREDLRLLTLTGSGGSGKTRLALHVAGELVEAFTYGVWFVALAGVRDPDQVPISIVQALKLKATSSPPLQILTNYLKDKQLLLVLDNFEQVGEAAIALDQLLAGAPGLKILVTSRAVLRLYGEYVFNVPPLDIPDPIIKLDASELVRYGAVQLFVERALAVAPDFVVTNENAAIIAQICARVDGVPLGLELAAARIRSLPPLLLLERISQARLSLLTGGARNLPDRQQTLHNTITWSYHLLSPNEQTWFSYLGVFTGGWSLDAAEAMMRDVTAGQQDTLDSNSILNILERLLDNSLLVRLPDTNGQPRFTMLETLREYAQERLSAQGMLERLRDWHACYYLREAEAAEGGMRGPEQLVWLARLTADRDNFRAALEWSLQKARTGEMISAFHSSRKASHIVAGSWVLSTQGDPGTGLFAAELCLRLASAFRAYWEWQGYLVEARSWLKAAMEVPFKGGEETMLAARAKALSELSRLVSLEDDQVRAVELVEESMVLWRRLDDPFGLAAALIHRAWAALATREYEAARNVCNEGLQYLAARDDSWLRAQLLFYLGAAAGFMGDFRQMRVYYTQSRELFEQMGDTSSVADVLKDHGAMMMLESKYAESIAYLRKSLLLCYELDHKQFITTGIGWLSIAVGMRGEPDHAQASLASARLEGASESLMETIGLTTWDKSHAFIQAIREYIRSHVSEQSWQEAWLAGRALTLDQAIDLVRCLDVKP